MFGLYFIIEISIGSVFVIPSPLTAELVQEVANYCGSKPTGSIAISTSSLISDDSPAVVLNIPSTCNGKLNELRHKSLV